MYHPPRNPLILSMTATAVECVRISAGTLDLAAMPAEDVAVARLV